MSKIRRAYESVENPDEHVVFRHAFKIVGDRALVNSMNTRGDDVVALEAVKESEVNIRARAIKPERIALGDITNHSVRSQRHQLVSNPKQKMPRSQHLHCRAV